MTSLPDLLRQGTAHAWLFVPTVSGIFLGSLMANRLAGKMDFARQIRIGYFFMLGAVTFNVTYHAFLPPALPWTR